MSQHETSDPFGHLEGGEPPNRNLSKLAELARQAFEQKRTKECLDLTRSILLIDPDNADAHWMRSSIQSDMHRDLENARAFLRQIESKEVREESAENLSIGETESAAGDLALEPAAETPVPAVIVDQSTPISRK